MAAPPTIGERMLVSHAIVGDAKDQVLELFSGSKIDDGKGIVPHLSEVSAVEEQGWRADLQYAAGGGSMVKSIVDLGETHAADGSSIHGWLIEVTGAGGASGWALYGEQLKGLDI